MTQLSFSYLLVKIIIYPTISYEINNLSTYRKEHPILLLRPIRVNTIARMKKQ